MNVTGDEPIFFYLPLMRIRMCRLTNQAAPARKQRTTEANLVLL